VREVLGIRDERSGEASSGANATLDALVQGFIRQRAAAKAARDFATSDGIRDQLAAAGIVLRDTKDGTTWELA
jgi:cysteinyl-tRNA synthetase